MPDTAELAARVAEEFAENGRAMTPVVARRLGVPEADVVRHLPNGMSRELDARQWEAILRRLSDFGKVHVITSNAATTLESFGEFGGFSTWGEYFNVQTKSLDMHIRFAEIATIFAVEKPSHMDGVPAPSLQFFTAAGDSAFKVFFSFGGKPLAPDRLEMFRALCNEHTCQGAGPQPAEQ